jgi:hypothetical protein
VKKKKLGDFPDPGENFSISVLLNLGANELKLIVMKKSLPNKKIFYKSRSLSNVSHLMR